MCDARGPCVCCVSHKRTSACQHFTLDIPEFGMALVRFMREGFVCDHSNDLILHVLCSLHPHDVA